MLEERKLLWKWDCMVHDIAECDRLDRPNLFPVGICENQSVWNKFNNHLGAEFARLHGNRGGLTEYCKAINVLMLENS